MNFYNFLTKNTWLLTKKLALKMGIVVIRNSTLAQIKELAYSEHYKDYAFRIFKTTRGYHIFCISQHFDYKNKNTIRFMLANFCDYYYVVYTFIRGFCVRLNPKFHETCPIYSDLGIFGDPDLIDDSIDSVVKSHLLLCDDYTIVRSPRSYNSQIGVPLSVWQMNEHHSLAIFEAGISKTGEMNHLQKIIQPTIGILTNIGEAHSEGFTSDSEKLLEKTELFSNAELIIYCKELISDENSLPAAARKISWSKNPDATVFIKHIVKKTTSSNLEIQYQQQNLTIDIPFIDDASIENCITCICTLLALNISWSSITERIQLLHPVAMRLQINKGLNNCSVLNDSYNNDVSSLSIVLDYLKQQSGNASTTVILSDILQSGIEEKQLYQQVAAELKQRKIDKLIGIGNNISKYHSIFNEAVAKTIFYASTQEFLMHSLHHHFRDEFILLKGARIFTFEKISKWLEQKVHHHLPGWPQNRS